MFQTLTSYYKGVTIIVITTVQISTHN